MSCIIERGKPIDAVAATHGGGNPWWQRRRWENLSFGGRIAVVELCQRRWNR